MSEDVWERLRAEANSYPMMFGQGVPDVEIHDAEKAVGCTFDASYVRFLKEFGGAMIGAEPILGLRKADVMGTDAWSVVEVTQRLRADGWPGVEDWYIVSLDGAGNPIGVAPDGAVYVSDHHGGGIQEIASSFKEFLSRRI